MKIKPNKTQFVTSDNATLAKARFAVVPVPWEKTTSYGHGTAGGPAAVIDASWQLEFWDEETGRETWKEGIFTAAPVNCSLSEKRFFPALEEYVEELLGSTRAVPFFIGGEHSVTQGLLPPFQKKHKGLSILHFDAHADLRPEYEGTPHSHASALYPASRTTPTVQVGIRSVSHDEKIYMNAGKVKTFLAHAHRDNAALIRKVLSALTDTVYITIDVDGFDPHVMPATGTPQPGGFGWYEALDLFRAVCSKKKIVGVDIVEVAPRKADAVTEFNAAKLAYRLMGYISAGRNRK